MTDIDLGDVDWGVVPTGGEPSARLDPHVAGRTGKWTGRLVTIAPDRFWDPLRAAFAERPVELTFRERVATGYGDDPYGVRSVAEDEGAADAILVVVPTDRSLATAVPAPIVNSVPVGVLPADDPAAIQGWLDTMDRGASPVPAWTILAMSTDRYLEPAGSLCRQLSSAVTPREGMVHDWRANQIDRPTLCRSLGAGPSLCVYLGHGTASGWGGYQNCKWRHVVAFQRSRPIGSVLSLSCGTLSHEQDGAPFGVRFVRTGRARTFVGIPGDASVKGVSVIADTLADVLRTDPPATIGELIRDTGCRVLDNERQVIEGLRIVGHPMQPLF